MSLRSGPVLGLLLFVCGLSARAAFALDVSVVQTGNEITIGNFFLSRTFSIEGDRLQTLRIENKRNNTVATVAPSDEFRLRFSQGTQTDTTDFTLKGPDFVLASWTTKIGEKGSKSLVFNMTNAAKAVQVTVNVELSPAHFFMRKTLQVTHTGPLTLEFVEV